MRTQTPKTIKLLMQAISYELHIFQKQYLDLWLKICNLRLTFHFTIMILFQIQLNNQFACTKMKNNTSFFSSGHWIVLFQISMKIYVKIITLLWMPWNKMGDYSTIISTQPMLVTHYNG